MIVKTSITRHDAAEALIEALNHLLLRFPLAGLSCLGEAVVISECDKISTLDTDGRSIRYSPRWILQSTRRDRIFDLLHEWLHVFFNHVLRCGDRDGKIWNKACDMVVVAECCQTLSTPNDKWAPPPNGIVPPPWAAGLTAEEIYDKLIDNKALIPEKKKKLEKKDDTDQSQESQGSKPDQEENENGDEDGGGDEECDEILESSDFDYAGARSREESPEKEDEFYRKFTAELAQANLIQQQIRSGNPGPVIKARLDEIARGRVPWGRLLKGDLLQAFGNEFSSYAPPKRKYYPEVILPSLKSRKEKILLIGVDDSASVGERLHKEFVANVLPAALRAQKVVVVTFDQVLREEIHTTRPKDVLRQVKFLTGYHSHTDARPVFDVADRVDPTAIVILTDGYVDIPPKPYRNTLWCIPINGRKQPWGKNYTMDVSW